jgi:hypothetical protein
MPEKSTSQAADGAFRSIEDLSHDELGTLAREHLLAGTSSTGQECRS